MVTVGTRMPPRVPSGSVTLATLFVAGSFVMGGCTRSPHANRASTQRSEAPPGFWKHWGDGRAEVNGYAVVQPRYGSLRPGEAVHIYVTETMRHDKRVKADSNSDDAFPVMKLNSTLDFQTGLYDYNVMTSTFVPLGGETPRGIPTKISFSMQEWCGVTHAEAQAEHAFGEPVRALSLSNHHYFDRRNAQDSELSVPDNGIAADALPIVVRGLAGTFATPGTRRDVNMVARLYDIHTQDLGWTWHPATVVVDNATRTTIVPAGSFTTFLVEIEQSGTLAYRYAVEHDPPHRIIAWDGPEGERGELTGTTRTAYWKHQRPDDAALRADLGLPPSTWPE